VKVPDRYIANHRGLPILTKKGNPVKRCQSMAPRHDDVQCEKWRKHNRTDQAVVHKNGLLIWGDNGRHEHVATESDVQQYLEKVLGKELTGWQRAFLDDAIAPPTGPTPSLFKAVPNPPLRKVTFNTEDMRNQDLKSMFERYPFGTAASLPDLEVTTFDDSGRVVKPASDTSTEDLKNLGDELLSELRDGFARADAADSIQRKYLDNLVQGSPAQEARNETRAKPQPLDEWWRSVSEQEIADTVPKAIEYGATDLIDIGAQLGRIAKRELSPEEAAELGCWFYLIGKMGRVTSALERGDWPSSDTVKDIGIYIKMVQRIRQAGSWPGEELREDDYDLDD
jgi:hypothetical protein